MSPFTPSYKRTMPSLAEPSCVVMIKSPVPRVAIVASALLSPIRTESVLRCTSPVPSGAIVIGELEALGDLMKLFYSHEFEHLSSVSDFQVFFEEKKYCGSAIKLFQEAS